MGSTRYARRRDAGVLPLLPGTLPGRNVHASAAAAWHVLRHQSHPARLLHGPVDDRQLLLAGGERGEGFPRCHHLPLADGLQRRRDPVPADTVREYAPHR